MAVIIIASALQIARLDEGGRIRAARDGRANMEALGGHYLASRRRFTVNSTSNRKRQMCKCEGMEWNILKVGSSSL